jgi:hypothetical protein
MRFWTSCGLLACLGEQPKNASAQAAIPYKMHSTKPQGLRAHHSHHAHVHIRELVVLNETEDATRALLATCYFLLSLCGFTASAKWEWERGDGGKQIGRLIADIPPHSVDIPNVRPLDMPAWARIRKILLKTTPT